MSQILKALYIREIRSNFFISFYSWKNSVDKIKQKFKEIFVIIFAYFYNLWKNKYKTKRLIAWRQLWIWLAKTFTKSLIIKVENKM